MLVVCSMAGEVPLSHSRPGPAGSCCSPFKPQPVHSTAMAPSRVGTQLQTWAVKLGKSSLSCQGGCSSKLRAWQHHSDASKRSLHIGVTQVVFSVQVLFELEIT